LADAELAGRRVLRQAAARDHAVDGVGEPQLGLPRGDDALQHARARFQTPGRRRDGVGFIPYFKRIEIFLSEKQNLRYASPVDPLALGPRPWRRLPRNPAPLLRIAAPRRERMAAKPASEDSTPEIFRPASP